MASCLSTGYGIVFMASMFILTIVFTYIRDKCKYVKVWIFCSLVIIGSILCNSITIESIKGYKSYKVIFILILLFTLINSDINHIVKMRRYNNKGVNEKIINIYNSLNFLKELSISSIILILILSILGVTYWYSYKSDFMLNIFESVDILTLSLLLIIILHLISEYVFYRSFCSYPSECPIFKHIYNKYVLSIGTHPKRIFALVLMFTAIMVIIISYHLFPPMTFSKGSTNHIYYASIHSQYVIGKRHKMSLWLEPSNNKCLKKHIYLINDFNHCKYKHYKKIYTCNVKADNLIFNLRNRKLIKSLGVKRLIFHLYSFNDKEYRFKCEQKVVGFNPINIRLVLNRR